MEEARTMPRGGRPMIAIGAMIVILSTAVPATAQPDGPAGRPEETPGVLPMGRLVFSSERASDLDLWMLEAGADAPTQLTFGSERDRAPALSPDGTQVAFSSDRSGGPGAPGSALAPFGIYLVGLDGGDPTPLVTNGRFNSGPDWSPDGTRIAYGGEVEGEDGPRLQVQVVPADGSRDPVVLTDDPVQAEGPAWSPDGSRIAFTSARHGHNPDGSWNRELYIMAADGSDQVRLTDDPAADGGAAWSPDGTRIAFHSDRSGNDDIYVMDADGADVVRLTDDTADDDFPTWSPDGSMIAFVSRRDGDRAIYVMAADGSGQVRLTGRSEDGGVDDLPSWGAVRGDIAPTPTVTASQAPAEAQVTPSPTALARTPAPSPSIAVPIPTAVGMAPSPAVPGGDQTIRLDAKLYFGGWRLTVEEARFDEGTGMVAIDARFTNLSEVERPMSSLHSGTRVFIQADGITYPLMLEGDRTVPAGGSKAARLHTEQPLPPDVSFEDALLTVGDPGFHQAVLPLVPGAAGRSIEPRVLQASEIVDIGEGARIQIEGARLMAATCRFEEGGLALDPAYDLEASLILDVTLEGSGPEPVQLQTAISQPDGQYIGGLHGGLQTTADAAGRDLRICYPLTAPVEGEYVVDFRAAAGSAQYTLSIPPDKALP